MMAAVMDGALMVEGSGRWTIKIPFRIGRQQPEIVSHCWHQCPFLGPFCS